jgi:hypothetical protein
MAFAPTPPTLMGVPVVLVAALMGVIVPLP